MFAVSQTKADAAQSSSTRQARMHRVPSQSARVFGVQSSSEPQSLLQIFMPPPRSLQVSPP